MSPHKFPIGVTRITYTATDNSGNSQSCVFTVTITGENFLNIEVNVELDHEMEEG